MHDRMGLPTPHFWPAVSAVLVFHLSSAGMLPRLLAVLGAFTVWFMLFAVATSWNQDRSRSLTRMISGVILGLATGAAGVWLVVRDWPHGNSRAGVTLAWILAFALYAALGIYGSRVLGKSKMVAAIIGPLMALLVLGWT